MRYPECKFILVATSGRYVDRSGFGSVLGTGYGTGIDSGYGVFGGGGSGTIWGSSYGNRWIILRDGVFSATGESLNHDKGDGAGFGDGSGYGCGDGCGSGDERGGLAKG